MTTFPASAGGLLFVTCTCESAVVLATPTEIWEGVPVSCGRNGCAGRQPPKATRRSLRRQAECGTPSGYQAHVRRNEPRCDACRAAMSEYNARYHQQRHAHNR